MSLHFSTFKCQFTVGQLSADSIPIVDGQLTDSKPTLKKLRSVMTSPSLDRYRSITISRIIYHKLYGSPGGPRSDFVFIFHFSIFVFHFLIFTSPFRFSVLIFYFSFWRVDYALKGSKFWFNKCDFCRLFHTERPWHAYWFSVGFVSGQCKTQTADCGPGVKWRLSVECRLQTESKMQAGCKMQTSSKFCSEHLSLLLEWFTPLFIAIILSVHSVF